MAELHREAAARGLPAVSPETGQDVDTPDAVTSATRTTSLAFLFVDHTGPIGADGVHAARTGGMSERVLQALLLSIAEAGGRELDLTVDSLPAVLPSASAAVACAISMQHRLAALAAETGGVALRIGIHVGEPLAIDDGRFFGSAIWTAARVCGRTSPRRILATSVVRDLVDASAAVFEPAGDLRLKGLADPVPVYDIAWEGVRPSPAADLRITSVLGVDQVGSTAIIDAYGDGGARSVHAALLDVVREAVEDHAGTEFEYGGDGVSVRFGSAVDAASCAVAMQQAAHRFRRRYADSGELHLRIAIVSGEVRVDDRQSIGRLASEAGRLGKLATEDRILLAPLAFALADARRQHRFAPLDDARSAYVLDWEPALREAVLPRPLVSSPAFVGRTADLEPLTEAWRAVEAGAGQRILVIDGDAGVGKTALLARFASDVVGRAAEGREPTVLYGRCPEDAGTPYEVLAEALSSALATASRADLRRMLGEHAAVLSRVLPVLRTRLPGLASAPEMAAGAEPFAIARALDSLLDGLTAVGPTLLVLDDVQDAAPELLTVLRALAGRDADRPLLIAVLFRVPDFGASPVPAALEDAARRSGASVQRLTLHGLTTAEVALLVRATLGEEPDDQVLRSIAAESEGIPYFVLELARSRLQRDAEQVVRRAVQQVESWRLDIRDVQDQVAADVLRLQRLQGTDRSDARAPAALDPEGTPPIAGPNPYRGLEAFQATDAGWFFGRERLTAELVGHLAVSRLLAVVGASGSGKSSVVRAGVLPALADGALPGSASWRSVVITPGADPVGALVAGVAASLGEPADATRRRLDVEGLAGLTGSAGRDDSRLVLVVDQAEELFTDTDETTRDRFVDLLVAAVDARAPLSIVLVMRSDFYGAWSAYPRLRTELERAHVLVGAMQDDEIRRAIESPASRAGLVVDGSLTDAVVADITGEAGALPLLSTVLVETWHRRRGRSLTLSAYAEAGGVRRAIAHLADSVLADLTQQQQDVARRLLLRLARPAERDRTVDVRRRARIEELTGIAPDAPAVLRTLVDRRLVLTDRSTAEVAHEALLREWPQLRTWLADDRQGRAVQQQLSDDAYAWVLADRDPDLLYQGARLAVAEDLAATRPAELDRGEREFLDRSRARAADELARARRTATLFRRLAVGLVVVLVVALVAGGFAVAQGSAASAAAIAARASSLSSASALLLDTHQDLGGLLAAAGDSLDPTSASRAALVNAANRTPDLATITTVGSGSEQIQAVSSTGAAVAVVTANGDVRVVDPTSRRTLGTVRGGVSDGFAPALSPSGRYLAVPVSDDSARVFDVRTGKAVRELSDVAQLTFPTDSLVAVLDPTRRMHYITVPTGAERSLPGTSSGGTVLASADGRVLVWSDVHLQDLGNGSSTFAGTVDSHVLDAQTGRPIGGSIDGAVMAVSADGARLALLRGTDLVVVQSSDGRVVRSVGIGNRLQDTLVWTTEGPSAAFDADASEVAFVGTDPGHPLYRIQLSTGQITSAVVPLPHTDTLPPVFASGRLLALGQQAVARFAMPTAWQAPAAAARIGRYEGSGAEAFVAADPEHELVLETEDLAVGVDNTQRYRLVRAGRSPLTLTAPKGGIFDALTAAFSPDGALAATFDYVGGTNAGVVSVWATATGREVARFGSFPAAQQSAFGVPTMAIALLPGTTRAVVITTPPNPATDRDPSDLTDAVRMQVWDWRTDRRVRDVPLGRVLAVAVSRSGDRVATVGLDGIRLWSTGTGRRLASGVANGVTAQSTVTLAFAPDGRSIAMGTDQYAARWRIGDLTHPKTVTTKQASYDHGWVISPDTTRLATIGSQGIEIRDLVSGRLLRTVAEGVGATQLLGFTPDSRTVVAWDDSALRAIDVADGSTQLLGTAHPAPDDSVPADDPGAAFTRDAVYVLTTTDKQEVTERFALSRKAALDRVCAVVGRNLTRSEWDRYAPGVPYRTVCARWPAPKR